MKPRKPILFFKKDLSEILIIVTILSLFLLPVAGIAQEKPFHFHFRVYDSITIRTNPTTQIAITLEEWPDNAFLLWLPESVTPEWNQWTPEIAHQDFTDTENGGLLWSYTKKNLVRISAALQPLDRSLACIVHVTNLSDKVLDNISAQNCFHLSQAPDFACDDFSRIFIRTSGHWNTLQELQPDCGLPMYYRPEFLESGKIDSWGGIFHKYNQSPRADHPLIMCVDNDGMRTIGTVSMDYQCVFHNRASEYLRCIHSQQAPVTALDPGETATFRQWILFVEGGVPECLRQFNQSEAATFLELDKGAYDRNTCKPHQSKYALSK